MTYYCINYKVGQLIEGHVPDGFKTAVVYPVMKNSSLPADDLKNYHPVSGLSFTSKRVECVLPKQLLEQFHVHDLDNP